MIANDILRLLRIFEDVSITCCLVVELALNYYNMLRVVLVRYLFTILVSKPSDLS
jgi:hypothetical protein